MLILALASLTGSTLLAQGVDTMTREGPFYVRTISAPVNGPVPVQLRIVSRGNIVLRGSAGNQVTYKLVQKVRARSEEEAKGLIGPVGTSTAIFNATTLTVMPSSAPQVSNYLEVNVPNQVALSIVEARSGSVEAYDLQGSVQVMAATGIRCDRIHANVNGYSAGGEIRLGKIGGSVQCRSGGGSIFV